ncbi:MAG: peptidylprolyl isomerase [Thermoanaerobaculia bacterium]
MDGGFRHIAALAIAASAVAGCTGGAGTADPEVVATLAGESLTRAQWAAWKDAQPEGRKRRGGGESVESFERRLLEQFVVDRIVAARVEAWDGELPERVSDRVESQRELLLQGEVEKTLAEPRAEVTEEEVRADYAQNPDLFGHDERIRLRHIYRRVDRDASPQTRAAAREEMEELRQRLVDGASFEDLARETSDSETAVHGGLIGVLDYGKLGEPLDSLVWSLGEGEVSRVVSTPVGFHIFRLDDRLAAERTPFEEARTRIERRLARERLEAVHRALRQELLAASGATYRPEALDSGDPAALLFELGEDSLDLEHWRRTLENQPFFEARELPERELLDNWALGRLYLWEAHRRGMEEDSRLEERLAPIRRAELADWLRETARREAIEAFSEGTLRTYFEAEAARFQSPRQLDLSLLVRRFPPDEAEWYGVYEELERLAERIRSGEADFAEEARRHSDDPSAAAGGRVGPVRMDAFQQWAGPAAQKRVLELAAGELSEPLLVERYVEHQLVYERWGYMLVLVHDVLEPQTPTFEEARERVVDRLVRGGSPDLEALIRRGILESAGAELFPENL